MSTTRKFSIGVAGLAAGATVAGMLLLGAGAAFAAAPPYEPDASSVGTITFYNAAGNVITSGSATTSPFAAYAVGSTFPRAGDPQAALLFANPDPGSTPFNWYKEPVGQYTQLPVTSGPSNIQTASQTQPVVKVGNNDQTPQGFEDDSVPSTTAGYAGNIQVRLRTATAAGSPATTYDVADIHLNGDGTWTQVYPTPKTATSTTLTATPSTSTVGDTVTLNAVEAPAAAGSVQFKDGANNIGSPVAVDSAGKASTTTSTLAQGSHSLTAVFTPTDTTTYSGSTGSATEQVNPVAPKTTTSLAVNQSGTAGTDATLTATVKDPSSNPVNAGTVSFYDGTSSTALNSSPVTGTAGVYSLDLPTGFAAGSHSIVAKFTPTDVTQFAASQSAPNNFVTQPPVQGDCAQTGSSCTDTQNITVTVPNGTLSITTPYTASSPLDLGTMALTTNDAEFQASAAFNGITITDTRSGNKGYTVSALAQALTDGKSNPGSTINAENVGLTNLAAFPQGGFSGTTTGTDNPAADPAVSPTDTGSKGLGGTAPHTVLKGSGNTDGTVIVNGKLTINAPTSTEAGIFTGTITFTIA